MKPEFDLSFAALGPLFGTFQAPTPLKNATLLHLNIDLADKLGLSMQMVQGLVTANPLPDDLAPFAMVYAGHQFGGFSPQLGDGRGLLLGERQRDGKLWDLHLKGAGKTPYSRFGDGRAVLRSSLREYLASFAMTGLGIPSSQALAIASSSEIVMREQPEIGATLLRVSPCHVRFGHFEYFYYQGMQDQLATLIDYCARRYLALEDTVEKQAEALLAMAISSTATLIAQWQAIGFAHGVMNTDNMSLIGETLDFGPYGFLDDFEPGFICNHSDAQGRYAFDRQPAIGLWNLNALAHALSGFIDIQNIRRLLATYEPRLSSTYFTLMMKKLGLTDENTVEKQKLMADLLALLAANHTDYTLFFRTLSDPSEHVRDLFIDRAHADKWLASYHQLCHNEPNPDRCNGMLACNPKFILRNHLAQTVIDSAQSGDLDTLAQVVSILQSPFDEHPSLAHFARPPARDQKHLTVSCSS